MAADFPAGRPALGWQDLPGRRVGVWGLGVEGVATLRRLASLGVEPVALVDDRPSGAVDGVPVLGTADGGLDALRGCDVVVKSPGISRRSAAAEQLVRDGVTLVGGLGMWLAEADRSRVVLVTGTKGKSTTSAVLGHLLRGLGRRCLVAGNIGQPPYDPTVVEGFDTWVLEVSSYQATDLAVTPPVVAVTSLHPDHLPWHGGVEGYYRDKLSACSQPGADLTVANGDSDLLRERRALLGPRVQWVGADDDPGATWMEPLGLLGAHNRRNALIARACLRALGVAGAEDDGALRRAAEGFEQLESRLRVIASVDGVDFVDDSLSTNVLPTLAAVEAFPGRRVALVAGGQDRGIDYEPLAAGLAQREAPTLVLAVYETGPRIAAAAAGRATPGRLEVRSCDGLAAAVAEGARWAGPGGVVLLSPAAPSFDRFRDYRERAAAFAAAVPAPGAAARPDAGR
ncbi:UDP-N-acetylmuramoyl-L-alanine--D-glutamate ligase [Motilibacter aurantiacus]|uniref:UDP-N-acetylmuramoyl-L-alanine--D-glutamate ligase n=1 Tax=Motilibacter aurantiacus TaxID=2714955 RepID=UPI001408B940|nr:UDP-N-acetylmuramoyl-L-alanine--D-glutamate ligase [Motilibacter aurantiacus]NHC46190.1 UDP-N-acetylmuramoyl-L-alanine--D-glutamate ligase [Motilibacter aurantiacus]